MLLIDDVHWADEDTISVLTYLADSMEQLPLALIMAARTEPLLPDRVERLNTVPAIRQLPLSRLTRREVGEASAPRSCLPSIRSQSISSSRRSMACRWFWTSSFGSFAKARRTAST